MSVSQLIRDRVEFYRKYEDRFPEDQKRKLWLRSGVMFQEFPTYLKSMMIDEVLHNLAFEVLRTEYIT